MVVFQIGKFAGFNLVEDKGSDMNQFDQQDFKSNLNFIDLRLYLYLICISLYL